MDVLDHGNQIIENYADKIDFITISQERKCQKYQNLISMAEQTPLFKVIGPVNWFASQTRADISFDMLSLNCNIKRNPTGNDLIEANKMTEKIKNQYFQS